MLGSNVIRESNSCSIERTSKVHILPLQWLEVSRKNPVKMVVGSRVSSILCNKGNVISIDENIISETIVYIYLDYVGQRPGGFCNY